MVFLVLIEFATRRGRFSEDDLDLFTKEKRLLQNLCIILRIYRYY